MNNPQNQDLPNSTVHHALQEASTEAAARPGPMTTGTFRVEQNVKSAAEEICGRHGTTLSEFLRKCCNILVRDYRPEPKPETENPASPA